jgi:hypothetical protein
MKRCVAVNGRLLAVLSTATWLVGAGVGCGAKDSSAERSSGALGSEAPGSAPATSEAPGMGQSNAPNAPATPAPGELGRRAVPAQARASAAMVQMARARGEALTQPQRDPLPSSPPLSRPRASYRWSTGSKTRAQTAPSRPCRRSLPCRLLSLCRIPS